MISGSFCINPSNDNDAFVYCIHICIRSLTTDLFQMKNSKISEAVCHISMIRSPGLLINAQRPLIQRLSLRKFQPLIVQDGNVG